MTSVVNLRATELMMEKTVKAGLGSGLLVVITVTPVPQCAKTVWYQIL
jgi:hypothetical protein